jgi:hypothetical protein
MRKSLRACIDCAVQPTVCLSRRVSWVLGRLFTVTGTGTCEGNGCMFVPVDPLRARVAHGATTGCAACVAQEEACVLTSKVQSAEWHPRGLVHTHQVFHHMVCRGGGSCWLFANTRFSQKRRLPRCALHCWEAAVTAVSH